MITLAFTGLALAAEASAAWIYAAVAADVAIVAASSYSAYAGAQAQRNSAKAEAAMARTQAEAQRLAAEDADRRAKEEMAKAGIAQLQSEQEAERRSRTLAADIGATYANFAANGLLVDGTNDGTFGHVLTNQVKEAQQDISTIRDNGRLSVWEHESQARSLLTTGKTSRLSQQYSLIGAASAQKNAKYYNTASYLGASTAGIASASSAVSSGMAGASYSKKYGAS